MSVDKNYVASKPLEIKWGSQNPNYGIEIIGIIIIAAILTIFLVNFYGIIGIVPGKILILISFLPYMSSNYQFIEMKINDSHITVTVMKGNYLNKKLKTFNFNKEEVTVTPKTKLLVSQMIGSFFSILGKHSFRTSFSSGLNLSIGKKQSYFFILQVITQSYGSYGHPTYEIVSGPSKIIKEYKKHVSNNDGVSLFSENDFSKLIFDNIKSRGYKTGALEPQYYGF